MRILKILALVIIITAACGFKPIPTGQKAPPEKPESAAARNKIPERKLTASSNKKSAGSKSAKKTIARKDVVSTLAARSGYSKMSKALEKAGLSQLLKSPGPFTIFAPSDKAWDQMPKPNYDALVGDKKRLRDFLRFYIADSKITTSVMAKYPEVKSAEADLIQINMLGGPVTIDKLKIITGDIICSNGVIHTLSGFITPIQKPAEREAQLDVKK